MISKRYVIGCLFLAGLLAAGCGGKNEGAPATPGSSSAETDSSGSGLPSSKELGEAAANLKKAMPLVGAEVGNAMQAMSRVAAESENVTITPVDFRTLRELLPETAGGLKRTADPTGERQMGVSSTTCDYGEESGAASLTITIIDTGAMRAMLAGGAAMAMTLDLDRETDSGYERNTTILGHKAHEKMEGDDGEVTVLVADRFLIEVRGSGIKADQLKSAVGAVPLRKLEALKDEGIEKAKPAGG